MMIDDPVLLNDWHPVASLDQLEQTPLLRIRLLAEDLVVWRTGDAIQVWRDLCIHRGARLSQGNITANRLACPYHGWQYNTAGQCVHIPAHPNQEPPTRAKTITYPIREKYGLVWTCLGQPTQDIPPYPEWTEAGFTAALCEPCPNVQAHGPRIIENFLDAGHFPFVHGGVLGDPAHAEIGDYEARITAEGVVSDPVEVYQPNPFGDASGKVHYTYRAFRPLTAHLRKTSDNATSSLLLIVTPHDALNCTAWFIVATTIQTNSTALKAEYSPRITAIFEEDRAVVETQRPELLPLDLQAELHLRSDRMAIAYRQWLQQLGLTYGTH